MSMTVTEMEIANLAGELVKYIMDRPGDAKVKVAALQVAQHILGQANAIEEANKAAKGGDGKKPNVGGAFL